MKLSMTKLFAVAASALFLAGAAYAAPVVEGEIVEAEAAVEAVAAETDGEAEAVEAEVEAEGEVGPAEAPAEDGVTKEAAAE